MLVKRVCSTIADNSLLNYSNIYNDHRQGKPSELRNVQSAGIATRRKTLGTMAVCASGTVPRKAICSATPLASNNRSFTRTHRPRRHCFRTWRFVRIPSRCNATWQLTHSKCVGFREAFPARRTLTRASLENRFTRRLTVDVRTFAMDRTV